MKIKFLLLVISLNFVSLANEHCYLIHGYGSAPIFMKSIESFLNKNSIKTVNFGYPSLSQDLVLCGESLYVAIKRDNPDTVSFVTHSMGALIFRTMVTHINADSTFPVINKTVMIAPANHGAEMADFFASNKILSYFLGPNIMHLTTDSNSLANRLPVPNKYDIGIIIGISKNGKGYNPFIKGNNDGYLTPQKTFLSKEFENYYVEASHSMIIHNKKVLKLVVTYLKNGKFE